MLSKVPPEYLKLLTVNDLETLLQAKREDEELKELMEERDRVRREVDALDERIRQIEDRRAEREGQRTIQPIVVKKRKTLKEYIVDVLRESQRPLTASEIRKGLVDRGFLGRGNNPRSFYNTVFQALQRYDVFAKQGKMYALKEAAAETITAAPEGSATLLDFVVAVLKHSRGPLKASEIASRVLIAGYQTDLDQDGLTQRVSALLKKHLNELFDWDSQRYKLLSRN
jgi:hypothetical protein